MLSGAPSLRQLSVGPEQCTSSDPSQPGLLKPNLKPWLIEEGMTCISQGGDTAAQAEGKIQEELREINHLAYAFSSIL